MAKTQSRFDTWIKELILESGISCQLCKSKMTVRVFSSGKFLNFNYLSHPGYGICLNVCKDCEFVFAEFVDPHVVKTNFEASRNTHESKSVRKLHEFQNQICLSQSEKFLKNLPAKNERILYYSAARSLYAPIFSKICNDLYVVDLIPSFRDWVKTQGGLTLLSSEEINEDRFFGFFDVIILPNIMNRLPFPNSLFNQFSRLLKRDGYLLFEVPITSFEKIREGNFGPEELSFFNENSINQLISEQKRFFHVEKVQVNSQLKNDPSTIRIENQVEIPRPSGFSILKNERPNLDPCFFEYNEIDTDKIIRGLSLASMIRAINVGGWLGYELKSEEIDHHISIDLNKKF